MAMSAALFVVLCLVATAAAGSTGTCTCLSCSNFDCTQANTICSGEGGSISDCSTSGGSCGGVGCGDNGEGCTAYCGILGCNAMTWSCTTAKCFPADATVELENGRVKQMSEVAIGDRVRVSASEFSDVYMFSHRMEDSESAFVQLGFGTAGVLKLTADHYIYVNGRLATASTVKVGDFLVGADGKEVRVNTVNSTRATGLFNPHTLNGDIVVNGVKTSTYTKAVAPALAHAALFPVRMAYALGHNVEQNTFAAGSDLLASVLPDGKQKY